MVDELKERNTKGHLHPVTTLIREISDIFVSLGFEIAQGPEIEDEYHNFDALNVPKDHPARDMWDTFWIKGRKNAVLRTHTSPVQIRYMEQRMKEQKIPPFKMFVLGKAFRYEATDMTHEIQFHQMECLHVGKNVNIAQLKWTLDTLLKKLFGNDIKIKFRPGYFPFVEPGIEIDMLCFRCKGDGCPSCKQSGWIEILGGGMVHPNVLNGVGVDPQKWSGLAFGVGIERIAMLKYGISDMRLLYSGDLRLVNQF